MKRRLIVLRHAKSSWESDAADDHSRPLNKRGKRDAPRVAAWLAANGWAPELVLSSDARRTRETWKRMADVLGTDVEGVTFTSDLYGGGVQEARAALAKLPASARTAMIIGHNPGWEELVAWLSGRPTRMTTANAALLLGKGATWKAALAVSGRWRLEQVIRPKELDDD
jgi:phosphohistidine phosphatase